MTEQQKSPATRQRLLEAAVEVFAEQGYRSARVRDICERAGANIAAINYHFGDKERLYNEVLQHAFFSVTGADPTDWGINGDAGIQEHLQAFTMTLLTQLLGEGRSRLFTKLVAREMIDPTAAVEVVIDKGIRPQIEILSGMVRQILGQGATEEVVRRCVASIVGQCLIYHSARPAIERLPLAGNLDRQEIAELAEHISRFSLAALRHMADDQEGS